MSEERGKRTRGGSGGESKRWERAGERENRGEIPKTHSPLIRLAS